MRNIAWKFFAAAIVASLPSVASATPADALRPFADAQVSDEILGATRGSGTPFGYVGRGQIAGSARLQSQFDQSFGTVGRVQMDVWWSSIGSELIATAVRAQLP